MINPTLSEIARSPFNNKNRRKKYEKRRTKKIVREEYAKIAKQKKLLVLPCSHVVEVTMLFRKLVSKLDIQKTNSKTAPEGANLGLGCGNPVCSCVSER